MQQGPHHKLIPLILLPEQITIIKCQSNVYPSYNMIVLGSILLKEQVYTIRFVCVPQGRKCNR